MLPATLAVAPSAFARQERMPVTGHAGRGLERFDGLIRELMVRHKIPGASLSLAKDGHLVYARGFGWARLETRAPVRPETLFGQASVSKTFTAVAILMLVETGAICPEDRAFAILRGLAPRGPGWGRMDPSRPRDHRPDAAEPLGRLQEAAGSRGRGAAAGRAGAAGP